MYMRIVVPNFKMSLVNKYGRSWMFGLFVNYKVNLTQFPGCWQKTRDSWVRDKGLHFTAENVVCAGPPCPSSSMRYCGFPRWILCTNSLYYS